MQKLKTSSCFLWDQSFHLIPRFPYKVSNYYISSDKLPQCLFKGTVIQIEKNIDK